MKRLFFLPSEITYLLFGASVYAFFKLPLWLEIIVLLVASLVLFLFRRGQIPYRETAKVEGEMYLSPVHGTVESVRHSVLDTVFSYPCHEVRVSVSFWDEKGLYLPTNAESSYLKASKGLRLSRRAPSHFFYGSLEDVSHTDLTLVSKNNAQTLIRFINCPMGLQPSIWLKSGDRGRGAACFGYYPFGGTLLLYLPATSDVLVYEKEKISPGQTVIAALKDQPKG